MISRFSYKDPIFNFKTRYPNLRIGNGENSILNVYRLISGSINCTDEFKNIEYKFRTDLLELPLKHNTRIKQATILNSFPEEVTLKDIDSYFRNSKSNLKFYKSIENEIINCFIAEKNDNHLEAFFYLYRIIEGISYSIPLIYVSKSKNYNESYKKLQSFFLNKQDGELGFFKLFISTIFKDEEFYKSSIDIDFNIIEIEELRVKYYNIYLEKMNKRAILDKTQSEEIKISFIGFYEFIITIRNRFFHYKQGTWQKKLSSTEVMFPDFFFKPIINHGLNWISIILFEIIKVDFSK